MKNLTFITQFGFSIISPIILMVWLGTFLRDKFNLGDWVVLAAIVLGLISAFTSAVSFFKYVYKQAKKSEESDKNEKFGS